MTRSEQHDQDQAMRCKNNKNLALATTASAVLEILALSVVVTAPGCSGFFVDPTITSMAVTPPTPSITEGETLQMSATGSYNDGSTKNITDIAIWSSSDTTKAKVSNSGVVTALSPGSASISASSGTVSGSTTVSVTIASLAPIRVSPSTTSAITGQIVSFTAKGNYQGGGNADVTDSVVWSTNSQGVTISNSPPTNGQATITGPFTRLPLQVTVTATSGPVNGNATLVVTQ